MSDLNKSYWLKYCPMGRMGELNEVASVVMFLASNAASFVNGQELPVNGGLDWAP
jgi:3-oxoacyl-[acyl-carrier protein] reductase